MKWFGLILTSLSLIALTFGVSLWIKSVLMKRSFTARYNTLRDNVTDMVIMWSSDFKVLEFNKTALNTLTEGGLTPDRTFVESVFGSDYNHKSMTNTQLIVNALNPDGVSSEHTLVDGTTMLVNWHSEMVEMSMAESVILSIGVDMTDKARISSKLEKERKRSAISEENFTIAMQNAEIGVLSVFIDNFEYKVEVSENGRQMLGFTPNQVVTLDSINEKVSAVDYGQYMQQLNELLSGARDALNLELRLHIERNKSHGFMLKLRSVKDEYDNVMRITGAFIDITSQSENQNLHDRNVYYDETTGLPNRRGIIRDGAEFLELVKLSGTNAALICLRIPRLQKISTLFGMEISDTLQVTYADTLTKLCENKNAVIGKVDNDDFVVLTEYKDTSDIETLVRTVHIVLENACNNENLPAVLKDQARCIAGICIYDTYDDVMTMYNKANITLYTDVSVSSGTCHYFDKSIEMKVCEKELIEQEISEAIKNNEFELYYQPKISFDSSEILGVEALMRWHHPKKGLMPPDEFIPAAEEIGLITKIDEWGMTMACVQNCAWQAKGYHSILMSVNMSQAQLYQTDIVTSIKRALDESGLSPEFLEVELTETMAMQDIDRTINILTQIKEIGVTIAMDDFGTGYSSLSSLKLLPIDVIKIDKSLVYDIGDNETARHITKAIVDLGKAMNLTVLAEGVETQAQYDLLHSLGCDIAQGFFYGKPQSAADIERLYLNRK